MVPPFHPWRVSHTIHVMEGDAVGFLEMVYGDRWLLILQTPKFEKIFEGILDSWIPAKFLLSQGIADFFFFESFRVLDSCWILGWISGDCFVSKVYRLESRLLDS